MSQYFLSRNFKQEQKKKEIIEEYLQLYINAPPGHPNRMLAMHIFDPVLRNKVYKAIDDYNAQQQSLVVYQQIIQQNI